MKKKKHTIQYMTLALVLIAIVLFIGVQQGVIQSGLSCSNGGTVNSLSSANLQDSSDLNTKVIRAVFSSIPNGDCLTISVPATAIDSTLNDKTFDATKPLMGNILLTKYSKEFTINEKYDQVVRKYVAKPITLSFTEFCSISTCSAKGFNAQYALKTSLSQGCNCVISQDVGRMGEFISTSQYTWETEISIGSQSVKLNQNTLSGKIGDIAFVRWAGNVGSNSDFDTPDRAVFKDLATNQWKLVEKNTYTDLNSRYDLLKTSLDRSIITKILNFETSSDFIKQISAYSSLVDNSVTDVTSQWKSADGNIQSATFNSNKFIVALVSPSSYPTFTLDIKATQVGIFISKGKPELTCPTNIEEFKSGAKKDVTVSLKNIGQATGSFGYGLTCNKGSQVLNPLPPINLGVGSSKSINVALGLTTTQSTDSSSCTFEAYDVNSLEKASCTFDYSVKKDVGCDEGETFCEAGNTEVWTCKADQTYNTQKCSFGCSIINGTAQCNGEVNKCLANPKLPECKQVCKWYDLECQSWQTILGLLVAFIVFIATWIFTQPFFENMTKSNVAGVFIALAVALIGGGLVGYFVYRTFWIAIGAGIVWIVLTALLNRFKK